MRVHSHNALYVAQFLNDHPKVELVLHAGLTGDPGYNVAQKQMSGFGGLMSFLVRGGAEDAMRVAANVKLFTRATRQGGGTRIAHMAHLGGLAVGWWYLKTPVRRPPPPKVRPRPTHLHRVH
jgi:cystathionine gamma-synthase